MKAGMLLVLAALSAAAPAPARAEALKAVPARLDPAKAYVLVEYRLAPNPMSNFPGSRKYVPLIGGLTLARYDVARADVRGLGRAAANPLPAKQSAAEPFRDRPVAKGDGTRLFLLAVEPDEWVVQGWADTSFSLGSYRFILAPGTVTDLGVVTAEADWAEGQRPPTLGSIFGAALAGPFGKRPDVAPARLTFRPRGGGDMPVPAGLAPESVRPVAFTPGATFGNYLGGLVNRIEGVNRRGDSAPAAGE